MSKAEVAIVSVLVLLLAGFGAYLLFSGDSTFAVETYNGAKVVTVVPVQDTVKCEVVGQGTSTYAMPEDGAWISSDEVGVRTQILKNFKITYPDSLTTGRPRLSYKICDSNKKNCGDTKTLSFSDNGETIELPDLDLTRKSYYIITETYGISGWWFDWDFAESTISYTYDKFGLVLHSSTQGEKVLCESSCDLSCPAQYARAQLVQTEEDSLEFYEAVNYISYWTEPSRMDEQLGGTVWNPDEEEFCFGGYIYGAGEIETETGLSYVYPKNYDRKEECCPGATISTSREDKICNNDYEWEVIEVDEETGESDVECSSDIQCPGAGQPTCQKDGSSYFKSGWSCEDGLCVENDKVEVACCPTALGCDSDQTCQDYQCVGGATLQILNDGEQYSVDTSDEEACEADGGVWVEPYNKTKTSGFIFKETEVTEVPGECKYPRTPIASIILIAVGIGIGIFSIVRSMFPGVIFGLVVTIAGIVYLIVGRLG